MQEFIKKGDELKRHKDRFSCEISMHMNLVMIGRYIQSRLKLQNLVLK